METVFGRDNIIVRAYDIRRFPKGDIGRDFLDAVDIRWTDEFIASEKQVNRSLTFGAAEAVNLIKRGLIPYGAGREAEGRLDTAAMAFSLVYPENKKLHFMDPEERRAFIDRYADSNRAVSERYLDGETLFDDEIEPYEVWSPDIERGMKNAETIIKLANTRTRHLIRLIEHLKKSR